MRKEEGEKDSQIVPLSCGTDCNAQEPTDIEFLKEDFAQILSKVDLRNLWYAINDYKAGDTLE